MDQQIFERKLTAIVCADMVGYSRLMGNDEVGTLTALKLLRKDLFEPKVAQYHGCIRYAAGDGMLMQFGSVVDAVVFAVEMQSAIRKRNVEVPEDRQIIFRVGINIGDVILEGEDISGDGVNVASRLENLAEPGGICVARNVRNQVRDKLDLDLIDLGKVNVKNIDRPVPVFRVDLNDKADSLVTPVVGPEPSANRRTWSIAAAVVAVLVVVTMGVWWSYAWMPDIDNIPSEQIALQQQDKSSIAVLPFTNVSGDPQQAYFVDGLVGDLIADLTKFRELRVASRSSTAAFQEKPADIQQVSQDLGVQYIVEGSIEKTVSKLRVTAQLTEVASGTQLWAERFDRELVDLLAVRDEIRAAIVGALIGHYGELTKAEQQRANRRSTDSLTARDYYYRAYAEFTKFDMDANKRARILFEKSIALDPDSVGAHWKLAWAHWRDCWVYETVDCTKSLDMALKEARKTVELDQSDYRGHWVLGAVLRVQGDYDTARAQYERAFDLNPNDPDMLADWGEFLSYSGQAEKSIALLQRAITLNPSHPSWYVNNLGRAYYFSRQYENSIQVNKRIDVDEVMIWPLEDMAASYGQLNRIDDAKAVVERLLKLRPDHSIETVAAGYSMPDEKTLQHFLEGLRKAGLPERRPRKGQK